MFQSRKRSFVSFLNSIASVGVVSIGVVAWLALAAAPANAVLITLCEGDCSVLGTIENPGSDTSFDFDLGLKVVTDGLDFRIETDGNIFLLGPLHAERLSLYAGNVYLSLPEGGVIGDLLPIPIPGIGLTGGSVLTSGVIEPSPHFDQELHRPDVGLSGGASVRLSALTSSSGGEPPAAIFNFITTGDVYLDVSMVSFVNLKLTATGTIVVQSFSSTNNVPEPSTAMLLGLGLVAFSARRKRVARLLPESGSR